MVYETLKFGFIPISFTYLVTVEFDSREKTICMKATVMKWTKIEMNYALKRINDVTEVRESIEINSPLPVMGMMNGIFKRQHAKLFSNMNDISKVLY